MELMAAVKVVAVCLAVIILWLQVTRWGRYFVNFARAYVDAHDMGVIEDAIEQGVVWADARLKELDGPLKMAWVLAWLSEHPELAGGVEVTEVMVERVYQFLKNQALLPPETIMFPVNESFYPGGPTLDDGV